MSKVVSIHPKGTPEYTLEAAKGEFLDVLVIGYDLDGELSVYSSKNMSKVADINFLVDVFKGALLDGHFETHELEPEEE